MRLKRDDEACFRVMLADWEGGDGGFTASLASLAGLMGEIDALRSGVRFAVYAHDHGKNADGAVSDLRGLLPPPEPEPMVCLRVVAPDGGPLKEQESSDVDPLG